MEMSIMKPKHSTFNYFKQSRTRFNNLFKPVVDVHKVFSKKYGHVHKYDSDSIMKIFLNFIFKNGY